MDLRNDKLPVQMVTIVNTMVNMGRVCETRMFSHVHRKGTEIRHPDEGYIVKSLYRFCGRTEVKGFRWTPNTIVLWACREWPNHVVHRG